MMIRLRQRLQQALRNGGLTALLLLALYAANAFAQFQLSLNDSYFVDTPVSNTVVLIALDDASFARYGRSLLDVSRGLYGDLLAKTSVGGARVVAFDILFSESSEDDAVFAEAITQARQSEARTRVLLAASGTKAPTAVMTAGDIPALAYPQALMPVPLLAEAGGSIGYGNTLPDVDSRIRRQPAFIVVDEMRVPSFSLATYLAYLRIPPAAVDQVLGYEKDTLRVAERSLPLDGSGLWRQNFYDADHTPFTVYSFVDVIEGKIPSDAFTDKIVLVGLRDSIGAVDQYAVPLLGDGQYMAGVEIQAHAIETLLQDDALRDLPAVSHMALIAGISLVSAFFMTGWRWVYRGLLALIMMALWLVLLSVIFSTQHVVVNVLYTSLAWLVPVGIDIVFELNREIRLRLFSEFLLETLTDVSRQRLELSRIAPLVAQDVRQIVPGAAGEIWFATPTRFEQAHTWYNDVLQERPDPTLIAQAHTASGLLTMPTQTAMPVLMEGRVMAVIALTHQRPITRRQRHTLEELGRRLAPHLENAALHRQLDEQRRQLDMQNQRLDEQNYQLDIKNRQLDGQNRQLDTQNQLLESILAGSPAGIFALDSAHRVIRANEGFAHWVEQPSSHLLHQTLEQIMTWIGMTDAQQRFCLAQMEAGKSFRMEWQIEPHTYFLDAAPLDSGEWVMTLSDVTSLMELNRLKTQMIRMASHDLKNPLSRVMAYAEMIDMDNTLPERSKRYLKSIEAASKEMLALIQDILSLEQLRSGKLNLSRVDLNLLLQEIGVRYEFDMQKKEQTYVTELPEQTVYAQADHNQLGQALSNLISNACKYTPKGGLITVRLTPANEHIRIDIQDTGYGIPADALDKLFTEFYRVKTAQTADIAGTGLGLSLVKSVIENHGGTINVTSVEGVGSTFTVLLPATR
jgi:signal transduction histidine kinase/CHASE2 domain-containing sensor protein